VTAPAEKTGAFLDMKVNVRVTLAALWTGVLFLYIYADYFGLYVPGALRSMLDGQMRPLGPVTQAVLLGTSAMMAIPSLMIYLSVAASARIARALNVAMGALYSLIILVTMWSWVFFIVYGVIEIALTLLVVWHAWHWPRADARSATGGEP
jgi:hypothetical protein